MLRDLLGPRPAADPPELAAALEDLGRLGRERPERRAAAETLGRVLRAAFTIPEASAPPPLNAGSARAGRRPVFVDAPPALDDRVLAWRASAICRALRGGPPGVGALGRAIRSGSARPSAWFAGLLAGEDRPPEGLDPGLTASVFRIALLPSLAAATRRLDPAERPDAPAACPHCDQPPLLAESRGVESARFLRCGLCAASWPTPRLACHACGEADARRLRHLSAEGEEGRLRLVLCESCGARLPVVARLAPLTPPALPVAELETAHYDALADRLDGL